MNVANTMQCQITKTNIGLKFLNYLPLTLTDFPSQALFARRLMLRVKLLHGKHTFLHFYIFTKFVDISTWQNTGNICKI